MICHVVNQLAPLPQNLVCCDRGCRRYVERVLSGGGGGGDEVRMTRRCAWRIEAAGRKARGVAWRREGRGSKRWGGGNVGVLSLGGSGERERNSGGDRVIASLSTLMPKVGIWRMASHSSSTSGDTPVSSLPRTRAAPSRGYATEVWPMLRSVVSRANTHIPSCLSCLTA